MKKEFEKEIENFETLKKMKICHLFNNMLAKNENKLEIVLESGAINLGVYTNLRAKAGIPFSRYEI
jgi:hypothetical protein